LLFFLFSRGQDVDWLFRRQGRMEAMLQPAEDHSLLLLLLLFLFIREVTLRIQLPCLAGIFLFDVVVVIFVCG